MKILAIDTATAACSAALMSDGEIIAARHQAMMRGHAEALLPMVEAVMAGVAYDSLGLIATTVGPGAFIGLRVGLAAARGLALAGGLPMIGVTTLEALAHGAGEVRGERAVVAVLNARREEVYYQPFDGALTPLSPPRVGAPLAVELPEGPVLLVANHLSFLDPALVGTFSPRPVHFVARSTLAVPLVGFWLRKVGTILIDRDAPGTSTLRIGVSAL